MFFYILIFLFVISALIFKYNLKFRSYDQNRSKFNNFPPGPFGFPILGYMPFLAFNILPTLEKLRNKYGDIYSIFLGNYRVIVLNGYEVIREAFKEDAFSGRPNLKMLEVRNNGVRKGLVCSEGKEWLEQKRFTMRQLKELGIGKKIILEDLLKEELKELVGGLRRDEGHSIKLQERFNLSVLNSLWKIICGERYNHNDPRLQKILKKTSADLTDTNYTGPLLFLPWLINLAPRLTRWNQFVQSIGSVTKFLRGIIEQHKLHFSTKGNLNNKDFIDSYLQEIKKTTNKDSSFYGKNGEHSLLIVLLDLFMAGADTTSSTLSWAFLYMIIYQNVQKKVQEEIDQVIGQELPKIEHRKKLLYTEATISEILRKSSLVPMGLFHCTTENIVFRGYDIPKDTVIMPNLYSVNNSKIFWKDPEIFRPERFIDKETKSLYKFDYFMPFSTGKRACPGDVLARDQLFIFFVGLLQQFYFECDPLRKKPTDEPKIGVILSTEPYYVRVKSRKN